MKTTAFLLLGFLLATPGALAQTNISPDGGGGYIAQEAKTIRKDPSEMRMPEDPSEMRMPEGPSEMRMPEYSIRVQVNGDRRLEGRKVIMKLRKGGRSTTRTVSLNSSGDADHRFTGVCGRIR